MNFDTILLRDGGAHFSGTRKTQVHNLPWMKLIVPLDGARVFFAGRQPYWTSFPILVAANVSSSSAVVGHSWTFFFAPEMDDFRSFDVMKDSMEVIDGARAAAIIDCVHRMDYNDIELVRRELVRIISGKERGRTLDGRVWEAKQILRLEHQLDVEKLAAEIGISASRLSHIFSEQTGISLRAYTLFRRLMTAFSLKADEKKLVNVAYQAGFSDQAHLSRTARRFLGQPASYGKIRK